jgi:hypothetical protein
MFARQQPGSSTRHLVLATIVVVLVSPSCVFAQALPITITKSFSPSTVPIGGTATTTMTVNISNPNGFSVSGVAFSDTYPAGLVPDQVGVYTCSAGSAVFTGTGWSLSNVTIGAGSSCSVPILMHATIAGPITNTTSQVTGVGVPPGGPASATLNVVLVGTPTLSGSMLLVLLITMATISILWIRKRTA